MALTPETEARGMKAYEQALAFERLRSWRLPLSFAAFALVPALSGVWMGAIGHPMMAGFNFLAAVFLAWMGRFQWKQLRARHARNLRLLAELKAEYGDQLPWIAVEKHFAALEQLQRELAEDSGGRQ
jgi:signal transduction histidine kinase